MRNVAIGEGEGQTDKDREMERERRGRKKERKLREGSEGGKGLGKRKVGGEKKG